MKNFIIETAKEAGKIALNYLGKAKISEKSPKNIVTEADITVEKYIVSKIRETFGSHNIVGEEDDYGGNNSIYTWYIDPIDGTANYAHGDIHFAISIALKKNHNLEYAVVYIPMIDELFYAQKGKGAYLNGKKINVSKIKELEKGIIQAGVSPRNNVMDDSFKLFKAINKYSFRARDLGFCAGQLAFVSCGRADGLVKINQHPWDFAAGILLIEEAGGKVTDKNGNRIIPGLKNKSRTIIASNKIIHEQLLELLKKDELKDINLNIDWY